MLTEGSKEVKEKETNFDDQAKLINVALLSFQQLLNYRETTRGNGGRHNRSGSFHDNHSINIWSKKNSHLSAICFSKEKKVVTNLGDFALSSIEVVPGFTSTGVVGTVTSSCDWRETSCFGIGASVITASLGSVLVGSVVITVVASVASVAAFAAWSTCVASPFVFAKLAWSNVCVNVWICW